MNKIEAIVAARNLTNELVNKFTPILRDHFRKFVGTKIVLVDGNMTKKAKEGLDLPNTGNIRIIRTRSDYSLSYEVTASVNRLLDSGSFCAESRIGHIMVGVLDKCVLTSVHDGEWEPLRTDYTVEEVLELQATREKARAAYDEAKAVLYQFD